MTQPDKTHHQRVLHHLRNASGSLEASRMKAIRSAKAHLATTTLVTNDDDDATEST